MSMIDARKNQLEAKQSFSFEEFLEHCEKTFVPLYLINLQLLDIPINQEGILLPMAQAVARATGIIEHIRMMPLDLRNGLLRMPQDYCSKYSLTYQNCWQRNSGRINQDVYDLVLE